MSLQKKLKVCHIAATSEGATWMFEQLRELRDSYGYDVSAIVSAAKGGLVDKLKSENIPYFVCDFDFTSTGDLLSMLPKVMALARLLRQERFDIVQTHLFHSMILGRLAGWLADVPVRLAMIAGPFHLEAHTPQWIDAATCWMETALIGSCEYTRTLYRQLGVPADRLALVYYGPDAAGFNPDRVQASGLRQEFDLPAESLLVGMVAYFYGALPVNRWIPPVVQGRSVKGHEYLIRAMPTVLAKYPNARLLLAGSGWEPAGAAYLKSMQRLVEELQLQDQVIFMGYRTDIAGILKSLDVSVQPSLNENLGGTIESLLMECPTVATRVGGMVDSVRDGQTGLLVPPSDAEALAAGILCLLDDPAYAKKLGQAGRQLMLAHFTLDRTASDLNTLYQRCLTRQEGPTPGYRRWVSAGRFVALGPIGLYLALRLSLIDMWLLPAWQAGWQTYLMLTRIRGYGQGVLKRLGQYLKGF